MAERRRRVQPQHLDHGTAYVLTDDEDEDEPAVLYVPDHKRGGFRRKSLQAVPIRVGFKHE